MKIDDTEGVQEDDLDKNENINTNDRNEGNEVEDKGEFKISCRWVLWKKEEESRAMLVTRGFDEEVPSYSSTVDKSSLRLILAIAFSEAPAEDKKLKNILIFKQMLNEKEISSVSWRKDPLDDCMTKQTATTFNLLSVFQSGRREGQ